MQTDAHTHSNSTRETDTVDADGIFPIDFYHNCIALIQLFCHHSNGGTASCICSKWTIGSVIIDKPIFTETLPMAMCHVYGHKQLTHTQMYLIPRIRISLSFHFRRVWAAYIHWYSRKLPVPVDPLRQTKYSFCASRLPNRIYGQWTLVGFLWEH